jgi:hypothetical protein
MRAMLVLAAAFWTIASQAEAQARASVYCVWMLLHDTHAVAEMCGDKLDAASERRYRKLRRAVEQAVVVNAPLHKGEGGKTPQAAQAQMDRYSRNSAELFQKRPNYCAGTDRPQIFQLLQRITSPDQAEIILDDLKTPRDPHEGACL